MDNERIAQLETHDGLTPPHMYICICNAVTEKQIHQAIDDGALTVDDLHRLLAVGSQCGSCKDCARQCLQEKTAVTLGTLPFALAS